MMILLYFDSTLAHLMRYIHSTLTAYACMCIYNTIDRILRSRLSIESGNIHGNMVSRVSSTIIFYNYGSDSKDTDTDDNTHHVLLFYKIIQNDDDDDDGGDEFRSCVLVSPATGVSSLPVWCISPFLTT